MDVAELAESPDLSVEFRLSASGPLSVQKEREEGFATASEGSVHLEVNA